MKLAVEFAPRTAIIVSEEYAAAMAEILANSIVTKVEETTEGNPLHYTETDSQEQFPSVALIRNQDVTMLEEFASQVPRPGTLVPCNLP